MKNKDIQLLEARMDEIYGTRGAYIIQVQLVDAKGNVVDNFKQPISGDEAAYQKYQDIKQVFVSDEEPEIDTYDSASSSM